jgi:hypothetical protein
MWVWLENWRILKKEELAVKAKKSNQYKNQKYFSITVKCLERIKSLSEEKVAKNKPSARYFAN